MVKTLLLNKKLKDFMVCIINNIMIRLLVTTYYCIGLYNIVYNLKIILVRNKNMLKKLIEIIRKQLKRLPEVMYKINFIYFVEMVLFYLERIISIIYDWVLLLVIMALMAAFYIIIIFAAGIVLTVQSICRGLSTLFVHIAKLLNDLKNVISKAVIVAFSLLIWIILIYLFLIMVLEVWLLINKALNGQQPAQYPELKEQAITETTAQISEATAQIKQQLKLCSSYFKRRTLMLMDRVISIFKSIDRALTKRTQHLKEKYSQQLAKGNILTLKDYLGYLNLQIKKFDAELSNESVPYKPI